MSINVSSRQLTQPMRNAVNYSDLETSDENRDTSQSKSSSATQQLKVVHGSQGRVRIRIGEGSDGSILTELSARLELEDGVTEVLHQQSSLVVKFDQDKLSLPQILALLKKMGIEQQPSASASQDPFAAWKSIDFWKEQGISFIPLFAGLGVTGALGISGWISIPVYLVTANATRRAIDYFDLDTQGESKSTTPVTTVPNPVSQSAKITYTVVHQIPGRIRFNIPRLAQDKAYARRLERMLKTDVLVKSVRLNCDAASVAIAYKQSHIPLSYWVEIMLLADQSVPPQTATPVKKTPAATLNIDVSSVWADYKPPAIAVFLDMMANLSLDAPEKAKAEVGNGS